MQIVHVGSSKAGSTFIQHNLFGQRPDIFHFGSLGVLTEGAEHGIYPYPESKDLTHLLVNLDRFKGVPRSLKDAISEYECAAEQSGKTFFFSNEHFVETTCAYTQAQVFTDIFSDPKILIVIRNQFSLLRSQYQYVGHELMFAPRPYKGRHVSFEGYLDYGFHNYGKVGGHKGRDWISDFPRIIDFWNFIDISASVVGIENIAVVPFEEMVRNHSVVTETLASRFGLYLDAELAPDPNTPLNESISARGVQIVKMSKKIPFSRGIASYMKRSFPSVHRSLLRGGEKVIFPESHQEKTREIFSHGNRKIQEVFQLDLARFGYPL